MNYYSRHENSKKRYLLILKKVLVYPVYLILRCWFENQISENLPIHQGYRLQALHNKYRHYQDSSYVISEKNEKIKNKHSALQNKREALYQPPKHSKMSAMYDMQSYNNFVGVNTCTII